MKKSFVLLLPLSVLISLLAVSCEKLSPEAPSADAVMDAPLEGLTVAQLKLFNAGAEEFDEVYTEEIGLGPNFVSTSCASCHGGDNRGHQSTMLTRFGQSDITGNHYLAQGGPQLQQFALPGYTPEVIPAGAPSAGFMAPIVSGLGFIELVPDSALLAMADPNDINADGISGVPNWNTIPDFVTPFDNAISQNGKYICRFGRKASTYNLLQQTATAFQQDMGVTTSLLPSNPFNPADGIYTPLSGDPEVSDANLGANVFYIQTLQTPLQRNTEDPDVVAGKALFKQIGCEKCHKETLVTGYSPITVLSNKTFHPYTDLLLHDMGSDLDDGYTEGSAKTFEWRTTPLWGLGLAGKTQGGNISLMHDGRAKSIEQAIQMHGGESAASRTAFDALTAGDKNQLLKFLNSL